MQATATDRQIHYLQPLSQGRVSGFEKTSLQKNRHKRPKTPTWSAESPNITFPNVQIAQKDRLLGLNKAKPTTLAKPAEFTEFSIKLGHGRPKPRKSLARNQLRHSIPVFSIPVLLHAQRSG